MSSGEFGSWAQIDECEIAVYLERISIILSMKLGLLILLFFRGLKVLVCFSGKSVPCRIAKASIAEISSLRCSDIDLHW